MRFGLIFSLILAIFAVVFALLNPQPMDVNLLLFETSGSTALILILTFGFGVLVGLLSTLPTQWRTRRKLQELQKKEPSESESGSSFSTTKSSSKSTDTGGVNSPTS